MKRALLILVALLALLFLALLVAAAPSPSQAGQQLERDTFVPTEKLPADSAISFPVDI